MSTHSPSSNHLTFSLPLLRWYRQHRRALPWRESHDPYRILVSEVMLQQTQVQTVIPYYHRFLKRFGNFAALARAPMDDVLKLWEGLGYYSRARNLHTLAKAVAARPDRKLPITYTELIEMPGIGRYTAGAVLSIAHNQPYPVVDGNVQRVLARFFGIRSVLRLPKIQKKLWGLAELLLLQRAPGDYNQAVMELGALICTPKNPDCPHCPLRAACVARHLGLQNILPLKNKKAPIPHRAVGAAVIWKGARLLISQRPLAGLLGGLWEFPGGKQEAGETMRACIAREVKEELNIRIAVGPELARVNHAYSHFRITLFAHTCQYRSGVPKALGCRDFRWVRPRELKRFAFPAANQPVIAQLLRGT